ncbi:MAG: hypothetical protein H6828_10660, partial [Planctomycetes bacterium]|nr:hypothetical protein [Planctomycetota bacterium]
MHLPSLRTALLPLLLTTLAAAQGSWSDRYDRPGVVGRVFAVGHDGPHLVVGGKTLQADGQFMNRVARWDGSSWSGYGDGVSGDVRAIAEYQGQLVVAGEFYAANGAATGGASVVHSIARWDGTRWQPLGGGLELSWSSAATVWDLEVFQGQLYAAGDFDLADGLPAKGIARWDGTQWQAVGGGVDKASSPKVLDMTVSTAGQLVVAGEFTHAGGQPRMNVAAWDGGAWTTLGAGLGTSLSSVFALEEFQGSIYAGGNFTSSGGAATAKVARWDGTTWQPLGTGIPDWAISSTIYSLQSFGGALYVGGNFDQAGGVLTRAVARWNGAQWSGVGGVGGTDIATTAIAMTEWNQQLVVGGEFEYAGTTLAAGQVTVSTSVATFDGAAWGQVGGGLGFDNEVYDAVHYAGGIAAVGRFTMAGSALTSQVAFFDGTDWRFIGLLGNG